MTERDIEPVDPQKYSAFTGFVENKLDFDPMHLDKLSDVERLSYLETKTEQHEYKASLFAVGILAEARSRFITPQYDIDDEIFTGRMGIQTSITEQKFARGKITEVLESMRDEQEVAKFFAEHDIDMKKFSFDRVEYGRGSMQGPDAFGFSEVLQTARMISNVELDRRIKRPFSKKYFREQFDEHCTKTGQDLTGTTYLRLIYLPKIETLYHETINNLKPEARYSNGELEKIIAGMSYPSTLFAIDKYEEIVEGYLGLIS